ncbi:hypothetical protein Tco_0484851 [Tanacetum coccineum]
MAISKEDDEMETDEEVEEVFEDEESETKIEEEVGEVFDDETEEEEDDNTKYYNSPPAIKELVYNEWLLKNPRSPCVKAKIMAENPSNIKISYTTSVIDDCLREFVFGKPFIDETGLVYAREEGTIMFKQAPIPYLHSPMRKTLAMEGRTTIKAYLLETNTGKTKVIFDEKKLRSS